MPLEDYWPFAREKLPAGRPHKSRSAVAAWPLGPGPSGSPSPLIQPLTRAPLRQRAAMLSIISAPGPQLVILEDVTGAGKTEGVRLILTHRLMLIPLIGDLPASRSYRSRRQWRPQTRHVTAPDSELITRCVCLQDAAAPSLDIGTRRSTEMSDAFPTSRSGNHRGNGRRLFSRTVATPPAECRHSHLVCRFAEKALLAERGFGNLQVG